MTRTGTPVCRDCLHREQHVVSSRAATQRDSLARWIVGPSMTGSLYGKPTSMTSAPPATIDRIVAMPPSREVNRRAGSPPAPPASARGRREASPTRSAWQRRAPEPSPARTSGRRCDVLIAAADRFTSTMPSAPARDRAGAPRRWRAADSIAGRIPRYGTAAGTPPWPRRPSPRGTTHGPVIGATRARARPRVVEAARWSEFPASARPRPAQVGASAWSTPGCAGDDGRGMQSGGDPRSPRFVPVQSYRRSSRNAVKMPMAFEPPPTQAATASGSRPVRASTCRRASHR